MTTTRVGIVGTGARAETFIRAVAEREQLRLVGMCDRSRTRMDHYNRLIIESYGRDEAAVWSADEYEKMVADVDTVIVTSMDSTHDQMIIPGLAAGARVITEKPMATSPAKMRRVLGAVGEAVGDLVVAFNYRFNPVHAAVHDLIAAGEIGDVLSVHFEWLLDTQHGADYFRRWHRQKDNSGGLMVHKAGHHFDLVNWWLGAAPQRVYGVGRLAFYGAENGARRGLRHDYVRAAGAAAADDDPFALRMADNPVLRALYLDAEADDGYQRDRNVFNDDITIEDDMAVLVTYETGATLTYHLTAYSPWEGYRVMFNGSGGRIELEVEEKQWTPARATSTSPTGVLHGESAPPNAGAVRLRVRPTWAPPREIEISPRHGGHGGADDRMLAALFDPGAPFTDTLATAHEAALAHAIGFAANQSFSSGLPVDVAQFVRG